MSDRFDPEAWPYPDDDEPKSSGNSQKQAGTDQDDYQSLDFDKPAAGAQPANGDPYSDAPYSDTGFDEYGYGNAFAANQTTAGGYDYGDPPSTGFGPPKSDYGYAAPGAAESSYDDDDFSTIPGAAAGNGADREPYGPADQGLGYDDDYTEAAAGSHRSSGSYDEDDPYGSQDGQGRYDDDDDDDYDDYDREPDNEGSGLKRKILGAVVILVLLLAAIFGLKTLFGGGGGDDDATTPTSQVTTAPTEPADEEDTPDQTGAPASTDAPGTVKATVAAAPAEVTTALNNALAAWGKFAVNGDLSLVQPYFASNGEQYKRLQADSEALKAAPPGGEPLSMTIAIPENSTAKVDDNNWIVRGKVTIQRTGTQPQNNNWEFRMAKIDGNWQVATIRNF